MLSPNVFENAAYRRPEAVLDAPTLQSAALLDLTFVAGSPEANALVDALLTLVQAAETRTYKRGAAGLGKLRAAIAAVVGGLLHHWSGEHSRPVFHPRQHSAFSGAPVGSRQFLTVVDALAALGMVHTAPSKSFVNDYGFAKESAGWAARYWPAAPLLALAESHGVTGAIAREGFVAGASGVSTVPPAVPHPIKLRALRPPHHRGQTVSRARPLPIQPDAVAGELVEGVCAANDFAARFDVCGCLPPRWFRRFIIDWRFGGRWQARGANQYQTMSEARRLGITIDGEPVAEIDVRASHLTILHGLLGLPLPKGDPYAIGGHDRATVKQWIVRTLGKGSPVTRWPADAPAAIRATSAKQTAAAVLARYPFLAEPWRAVADLSDAGPPQALLIHRLQGLEAAAMTAAMWQLRSDNVLALPVHDALLVPASAVTLAAHALQDAFRSVVGVTPQITRKVAEVKAPKAGKPKA
jgi:hypothetical protein